MPNNPQTNPALQAEGLLPDQAGIPVLIN